MWYQTDFREWCLVVWWLLTLPGFLFGGRGQSMDTDGEMEPLPEDRALKCFKDLIEAVRYMHGVGIIHRDIKPENLLLTANDTVKLADFGTGQIIEGNDMINKSAGTPAFTAPEACVEGDFSGFAADVWACGVTPAPPLCSIPLPRSRHSFHDLSTPHLRSAFHSLFRSCPPPPAQILKEA
jgi:serine/threonine protein kinase